MHSEFLLWLAASGAELFFFCGPSTCLLYLCLLKKKKKKGDVRNMLWYIQGCVVYTYKYKYKRT